MRQSKHAQERDNVYPLCSGVVDYLTSCDAAGGFSVDARLLHGLLEVKTPYSLWAAFHITKHMKCMADYIAVGKEGSVSHFLTSRSGIVVGCRQNTSVGHLLGIYVVSTMMLGRDLGLIDDAWDTSLLFDINP